MERRRELMAAAVSRFGLLERERLQTHFSEHSLVCSYRRGAETVYVRLTDESHKPYAKIEGEVQWAEFLGSKGVCVSRPLYSVEGNLAERIRMEDREYTAVCYEEAKGRPVGENDANERLYKRMGQFMGSMHRITKGYTHLDPVTRRPDWSDEEEKVRYIDLPLTEKGVTRRYEVLLHYISELPIAADAYGLIHADFHYGNFFVNGDTLCLIDFDASRYSWFIDDIAVAAFFSGLTEGADAEPDQFLTPFLEGYRLEHHLEDKWFREIPYFMKLREMGRYIKLFHACSGKLDKLHPWGQWYMRGRKEKILRSFPAIE
ncbi:phosphotransferase enzyme family protein [Paenibacillus sp. 2KB_20]|uniref:phosphotransferase enzyme family protein n=1 Tax=Paenibacillus sp. 2KB_20 TaxID=3232977 RepID=UPI003F9AA328